MNLSELRISVLDELDTVINSPVVNPDEVRDQINRLFDEAEHGQKEGPDEG